MTHSSRRDEKQASQVPEFFYDIFMAEQKISTDAVRDVIEQIVFDGASILHTKYLQSQIKPYASKTLARELVMNASWALEPLGDNSVFAEPDNDLDLPPIDEWAGGVLPVRSPDAIGLRSAIPPPRENKNPPTAGNKHRPQTSSNQTSRTAPSVETKPSANGSFKGRSNQQPKETPKKKPKPAVSEAVAITRLFEEAKKKTSIAMKSVTVDSDFTVIQITEPHGLPPALIVPKVTTKRATHVNENPVAVSRGPKPSIVKPAPPPKKKTTTKLIEPDLPIFDEEVAEVSYSEKFVCAPGVTFKDGNVVKTRAQQANPNQMTRAQYEQYLEELKRGDEVSK